MRGAHSRRWGAQQALGRAASVAGVEGERGRRSRRRRGADVGARGVERGRVGR